MSAAILRMEGPFDHRLVHETISPEMLARARNDAAELTFALARFASSHKNADYWAAIEWLESALETLPVPHVRVS